MIVPDANLLVYAYDATAPAHAACRRWWEQALSGSEPVGIPWIVVLAFTRLMTHPTLSKNPMTVEQARDATVEWFEMDHVRLLSAGTSTFSRFFELLAEVGTGGNLSTGALIAALALENGGTVHSNDSDFGRFRSVSWRNPLAAS